MTNRTERLVVADGLETERDRGLGTVSSEFWTNAFDVAAEAGDEIMELIWEPGLLAGTRDGWHVVRDGRFAQKEVYTRKKCAGETTKIPILQAKSIVLYAFIRMTI